MANTNELVRNWRIWFLVLTIMLSALLMMFNGLRFGIDFEGGTMFQIHLAEKAPNMEEVSNIIERRLNWSGLQDVRVYATEGEFVFVVVRQTAPEEVKRIESLIRQQGHFEVLIEGNVMFTGSDLVAIDHEQGYERIVKTASNLYQWRLPFMLSMDAAKRFRDLAFHKCEPVVLPDGSTDYECASTYFFIDRPVNYLLVSSKQTFERDKEIFLNGTREIPKGTHIEEVIENIGTELVVVDENAEQALAKIAELSKEKKGVLADSSLSTDMLNKIKALGVKVKTIRPKENEPWLYTVSGLRSIVRLTPSVTGNKPYVERKEDAKILTDLLITGTAQSLKQAQDERSELKILLNSGALPVSVESISNYWVSPTQGKEFLFQVAIIGIIVLFAVSAFIIFRYRKPMLSAAIIFTALVEAFVTSSFTSALGQSLDIATLAGIIAAVGTGVDDQIIITDELLMGRELTKEAVS
ncbi:MAG: hypothetical protein J7L44_01190, partial [Candidatus Diapherotrites archaeon]|nr:hypothetical protein [Candidatus Diapherotrites archaeon]